jgi:type IV pilus assembly protein PilV
MKHERGVSMVEALVALVVLSVGMLGIASLYVSSLQAERTALIRGHAVYLVSDMADRIRANALAREFYGVAKHGGKPATQSCAPEKDKEDKNCSVEQLAQDDLARWIDSVTKTLPGTPANNPQATVVFTAGTGAGQPDRFRIAVAWREPGDTKDLVYENNLEIIPGLP